MSDNAVARFDERSTVLLNGGEDDFTAIGATMLSGESGEPAKLPLARTAARGAVPLTDSINPASADAGPDF